ncbi:hypothetical protein JIG36_43495 [Actinoplanes sp. LDG1-06]|uniref:Uncharacterized protein n=1 Tax=Paractinoplanes ovalisporus TaxID=2810368 RepID=A0ABS2ARE4_9ACTN|nr:hypothetical protein [Actinoplanes ovalisporus]MBM2622389.1 hypothetical protein [Actinoplanes ovalisporus]
MTDDRRPHAAVTGQFLSAPTPQRLVPSPRSSPEGGPLIDLSVPPAPERSQMATAVVRRPSTLVAAGIAVFLAGGVTYATFRPAPAMEPAPPAATAEVSPPAMPPAGRSGIPAEAAERARRSPDVATSASRGGQRAG